MTPKIPNRIKVGPYWYYIEKDDQVSLGSGDSGECDLHKHVIKYSGGVSGRFLASTLLHETLHAIYDSNGEADVPEDHVERTATALLQVVVDSPGFLEYLTEIRDDE